MRDTSQQFTSSAREHPNAGSNHVILAENTGRMGDPVLALTPKSLKISRRPKFRLLQVEACGKRLYPCCRY